MILTDIKERPILFSTPMVQAILEGRKTVTRRIVKPQPDDDGLWNDTDRPRSLESVLKGWNGTVDATGESKEFRCPYDADVLWVRESHYQCGRWLEDIDDGEGKVWSRNMSPPILYHADDPLFPLIPHGYTWRSMPSIHMHRSDCRLRLEIQSIRVERLHDITLQDTFAEGIAIRQMSLYGLDEKRRNEVGRIHFGLLWKKINGAESWNSNPWVWRIEFKKLEQ